MSSAHKKPAQTIKKTPRPDVDKPGKSAPPATSKPVIVSNRPLLKDPMVVDEEAVSENEATEKEELAHSTGPKLKPLKEPATTSTDTKENQPAEDETPPTENDTKPQPEPKPGHDTGPNQTKHGADIQKLIDSRKYELPINAVEKRKTKRFVVLGVFLAILLALAWADIALDAGLVKVSGIKPVTHFFSN
jgi:hypothetical protein